MNDLHDFDALARQKLEQRDFPFEEADWADAERMIKQRRGRRSRRALWYSLAALLFIGGGVLWSLQEQEPGNSTAAVPSSDRSNSIQTNDQDKTSGTTIPSAPLSHTTEGVTPLPASNEIPSSKADATSDPSPGPVVPTPRPHDASRPAARKPAFAKPSAPTVDVAVTADTGPVIPRTENVPPEAKAGTVTTNKDRPTGTGSTNTNAPVNGSANTTTHTEAPPPDQAPITTNTGTTNTSNSSGTNSEIKPTTLPTVIAAVPAVGVDTIKESEAYVLAATDSIAVKPGDLLPLAPVVAATFTEVSAYGGLLSSSARYNGGSSGSWGSDVRSLTRPSFGLEMARMGAHFGYGAGLQYADYADALDVQEKNTVEELYSVQYHLLQVDTMVTVVVDTIFVQGQTYYVTEQVGTTIHVLTSETDTARVIHQERAARELINSVRYVEMPFFVDAHINTGSWSFGIRGGPSIGLLSGRRGAVPNDAYTGYLDLGDVPFQQFVFGYQARVYARFRFTDAWSIGVEPTIRGQFSDEMDNAGLSRKGSAVGGLFSLTYRLP